MDESDAALRVRPIRLVVAGSLLIGMIAVSCGDDAQPALQGDGGDGGGAPPSSAGKAGLAGSSQAAAGAADSLGGTGMGGAAEPPGSGGAGGTLEGSSGAGPDAGEAGTAGAGTSQVAAGAGGIGGAGAGSDFAPGQCQSVEPISPSVLASCEPRSGDSDCISCVKLMTCAAYRVCFGEEPASACGTGRTPGEAGQFVCIAECFAANAGGFVDDTELLAACANECSHCPGQMINDDTSNLIADASDPATCRAACFPFD